jgi:long-chain fatty acid transport protein
MNKLKFAVLCLMSAAAAGGYRVQQSNKQLAMGHTGVAVVNSADVLFFNPAGLVHLESKLNVSAGGFGVFSDVKYQNEGTGAFCRNGQYRTPFYLYAELRYRQLQ